MAENKQNDCVSFREIQKSYPPGEPLKIFYELQADYKPASRDWVGLFQVGWTSSRDYYTFEWAPTPEEDRKGTVTFAGRRLPPEDSHFYQFCYVSSNGRVRGASPPFQFSSASLKQNVEDLELVEVKEDSLMMVQQKPSAEEVIQEELLSVRESVSNLELEKKTITEQMAVIQAEKQQQSSALKEKEEEMVELQKLLQEKCECEQRALEKLERQREENNTLMAVKNDEDAQRALLVTRLASKEEEISQQGTTILTLTEELKELKSQVMIRDSQVEDLTQLATARGEEKEQLSMEVERITAELLTTKGQFAESLEQCEHLTIENEQLALNLEESRKETELAERKAAELQQELNIATENISELMGQREVGVVFDRPVALPQPPTAPAAPPGTVDLTVYASLLEAFENVQKYYEDVKVENVALQLKNDELTARVVQCQQEYAALAEKVLQLKEKKKADGARIKELEEQLEDYTQGCGTAIAELSSRKEEIGSKDAKIAELEEALQRTQYELEKLQDKHDTETHRRVEACDISRATLDQKIEELTAAHNELAKLKHANNQLKTQLESLKSTAQPAGDRTCPVCATKFPTRMRQQDFENHVQGHFRAE